MWDYLDEQVKHHWASQTLADMHLLMLTRHWWHSYLMGLVLLLMQRRGFIFILGSLHGFRL